MPQLLAHSFRKAYSFYLDLCIDKSWYPNFLMPSLKVGLKELVCVIYDVDVGSIKVTSTVSALGWMSNIDCEQSCKGRFGQKWLRTMTQGILTDMSIFITLNMMIEEICFLPALFWWGQKMGRGTLHLQNMFYACQRLQGERSLGSYSF